MSRAQRTLDNDADFVGPLDMLAELRDDNKDLGSRLRAVHALADDLRDIATASLMETWVDETERRIWFLFEVSRRWNIRGSRDEIAGLVARQDTSGETSAGLAPSFLG
jgi:starvation-inducible DNA-binding protein